MPATENDDEEIVGWGLSFDTGGGDRYIQFEVMFRLYFKDKYFGSNGLV